jgi:hypothetical protein
MPATLKYINAGVATVTNVRLSGQLGLGVSVLLVQVEAMTQTSHSFPSHPAPRIVKVGGRLFVSGHNTAIAPLVSRDVLWLCVDHAAEQSVTLEAFLTNPQVRAIDEARDSKGDLHVTLSLDIQADGSEGVRPGGATYPVIITSSEWSRLLSEMHFEDRATFEVPIAGGRVGPPLDKAATFVRAAIDRLHHRQWSDALTQCRQALEALIEALSLTKTRASDWSDRVKREDWSLNERLMATLESVRHMSQAGPHPVIGIADEQTVRFVVTTTAALLRLYASR